MRETLLFIAGLSMGAANSVRHRAQGYVNPRPFSPDDISRTIDHAIAVVDRLERDGGLSWEGQRVLEIGPGSDLSTGAVVLSRGAASYCAVDLFDNRDQAHPALYEQLGRTLGTEVAQERLHFRQTSFPELPDVSGKWDVIVSNATLEHIDQVPHLFDTLARLAAPGARMAHHIDAQTHMRGLKEIDPWNILRYPDFIYDRILRFPGAPNRMLSDDYAQAARSAGWAEVAVIGGVKADGRYLADIQLAKRFRDPRSNLRFLTFTLVATLASLPV